VGQLRSFRQSYGEDSLILIGLDPGLGCTGWGVIAAEGNRLSHIANGQIRTDAKEALPQRLVRLHDSLCEVLAIHRPGSAAVEEVFVNENPQSTLKLGQARGVVLLAAASRGIAVDEYAARLVKKAVVGTGGADKIQVHAMVGRLLPGVKLAGADSADALAVAITHAHHLASARALRGAA
jgi:crossover junction endodeoxyribonuclease RuvC